MKYNTVTLNDKEWLILDAVGDKYFMLAESPLFRGYYSLQPCEYAESRLAAFLTNKYLPQMERGGVDISKITNLRIPTVGQYMLYIKDKLPASKTAFLLQTPHPRKEDCILAIDTNGEMFAAHVTDSCGIRPCMFADKKYINVLAGVNEDLTPIADIPEEQHEIEQQEEDTISPDSTASEPSALIVPEQIAESDDEIDENATSISVELPEEPQKNKEEPSTLESVVSAVTESAIESEEVTIDHDELANNDTDIDFAEPASETQDDEEEIIDANIVATNEDAEIVNDIVPEYDDEDTAVIEADSEYNIDEIISLVADNEIVEQTTQEVVSSVITSSQQKIEVKQIGDTAAVYLFDDYKEFGVLCDNDVEDVQKVISEYGLIVQDFLATSNTINRKSVSKDDIFDRIKQQQQRWRWNT